MRSEPAGGRIREHPCGGAQRVGGRAKLDWRRWAAPGLRRAIERRYPGVPWIETAELAALLQGPPGARPLLLDARSAAEFAVSRIAGAQRVEPAARDVSPELARAPAIVVYCSLGYRSAALCQRLRAAGARDARNLAGGLFQWANEGRALCTQGGAARVVHPYGALWGLLLYRALRAPLR